MGFECGNTGCSQEGSGSAEDFAFAVFFGQKLILGVGAYDSFDKKIGTVVGLILFKEDFARLELEGNRSCGFLRKKGAPNFIHHTVDGGLILVGGKKLSGEGTFGGGGVISQMAHDLEALKNLHGTAGSLGSLVLDEMVDKLAETGGKIRAEGLERGEGLGSGLVFVSEASPLGCVEVCGPSVKSHAEGKEVGALVEGVELSLSLFGGLIEGSSQTRNLGKGSGLESGGEAKIPEKITTLSVAKNISGFKVEVKKAGAVGVGKSLKNLLA